MSIEGGTFICYRHDFESDDVKEWDQHCFEEGHTIDATQQCKQCGEWNEIKEYPYPERFVELSHANTGKDVLVLKCSKCGEIDNNEV